MPPFLDGLQLQQAITTRAIPVLEFLAEHPNYLEQTLNRRFDRDEPPQYESLSESEGEQAPHHPMLAQTEAGVLKEFYERIKQPLSDNEVDNVLDTLEHGDLYAPGIAFSTRRAVNSRC